MNDILQQFEQYKNLITSSKASIRNKGLEQLEQKIIDLDKEFQLSSIPEQEWDSFIILILDHLENNFNKSSNWNTPQITFFVKKLRDIIFRLVSYVEEQEFLYDLDSIQRDSYLSFSIIEKIFKFISDVLESNLCIQTPIAKPFLEIIKRCILIPEYSLLIEEYQFKKFITILLTCIIKDDIQVDIRVAAAQLFYTLIKSYQRDLSPKISKGILLNFQKVFESLTLLNIILPFLKAMNFYIEKNILNIIDEFRITFKDLTQTICQLWDKSSSNIPIRVELCILIQFALQTKSYIEEIPLDEDQIRQIYFEFQRTLNSHTLISLDLDSISDGFFKKNFIPVFVDIFYYRCKFELEHNDFYDEDQRKRRKTMSPLQDSYDSILTNRYTENWLFVLSSLIEKYSNFEFENYYYDSLIQILISDNYTLICKESVLKIIEKKNLSSENFKLLFEYTQKLLTSDSYLFGYAFLAISNNLKELEYNNYSIQDLLHIDQFPSSPNSSLEILKSLLILYKSKFLSNLINKKIEIMKWIFTIIKTTNNYSKEFANEAIYILFLLYSINFDNNQIHESLNFIRYSPNVRLIYDPFDINKVKEFNLNISAHEIDPAYRQFNGETDFISIIKDITFSFHDQEMNKSPFKVLNRSLTKQILQNFNICRFIANIIRMKIISESIIACLYSILESYLKYLIEYLDNLQIDLTSKLEILNPLHDFFQDLSIDILDRISFPSTFFTSITSFFNNFIENINPKSFIGLDEGDMYKKKQYFWKKFKIFLDIFTKLSTWINSNLNVEEICNIIEINSIKLNTSQMLKISEIMFNMGDLENSEKVILSFTDINSLEYQIYITEKLIMKENYNVSEDILKLINSWIQEFENGKLSECIRFSLCKLIITCIKKKNLTSFLSNFFDFIHDNSFPIRLMAIKFTSEFVSTYDNPMFLLIDIISEIKAYSYQDTDNLKIRTYFISLSLFSLIPSVQRYSILKLVEAKTKLGGIPFPFFEYINQFISINLKLKSIESIYSNFIEDIVYYCLTNDDSELYVTKISIQLFGENNHYSDFYRNNLKKIAPILISLNKIDILEEIANILNCSIQDILIQCLSSIYAYWLLHSSFHKVSIENDLFNNKQIKDLIQNQRDEIHANIIYFTRKNSTLPFFPLESFYLTIDKFSESVSKIKFIDSILNRESSFFVIITLLMDLCRRENGLDFEALSNGIDLILNLSLPLQNSFILDSILYLLVRFCILSNLDNIAIISYLQKFFDICTQVGISINIIAKHFNEFLQFSCSNPDTIFKKSLRNLLISILDKFGTNLICYPTLNIPNHPEFFEAREIRFSFFKNSTQLIIYIEDFISNDSVDLLAMFFEYIESVKTILSENNILFSKFVLKLSQILKGQFNEHSKRIASSLIGNLGVNIYSYIDSNFSIDTDEFEFYDPKIPLNNFSSQSVKLFYYSKLLSLLYECLDSMNYNVVKIAIDTIYNVLISSDGDRSLSIVEEIKREKLLKFKEKPLSSNLKCKIDSKFNNLQELFSSFYLTNLTHDDLIKNLAYIFLNSGYSNCPFLSTFGDISFFNSNIAEIVWIISLFEISTIRNDTKSIELIQHLINSYVIGNRNISLKTSRLFIFSIRMLYKFIKFSIAKQEISPSKISSNLILDISPIELAKESIISGAPISALQFMEMILEEDNVLKPLLNQNTIIFENNLNKVETLLREIYINLGEPDSIYGIPETYGIKSQIFRSEHEENWFGSLSMYDSLLQEKLETNKLNLQEGLFSSLQNLGYKFILNSLSDNYLKENKEISTQSLQNKFLEIAWKNEKWDTILTGDNIIQGYIFQSLRQLKLNYFDKSLLFLDSAQDYIHFSISHNFLSSIVFSHMISDIRQIASTKLSGNDTSLLFDEFMNISNLQMLSFGSIESLLSLRGILISMQNSNELIIKYNCKVAALARKLGNLEYALSIIRSLHIKYHNSNTCPIWIFEEAKVLWKKGERTKAISVMKFFSDIIKNTDEKEYKGQSMRLLAKWYGSTLSVNVENIRSLFEQSETLIKDVASSYYSFAKFEDSLYMECERKLRSEENLVFEKLMEENKKKLQDFKKELNKSQTLPPDLQKAFRNLKRSYEQDQRKKEDLAQRTKQYLCNALGNYGKAAINGDTHSLETVFRFVSLWLKIPKDSEVNKQFWKCFVKIAPYKFVPLVYQIASRLGSTKISRDFNAVVQHTLLKISEHSPYHSLYQLFALKNGSLNEDLKSFTVDEDRIKDATNVLSQLKKTTLGSIIDQMDKLINAYVSLAYYIIPENHKSMKQIPIPESEPLYNISNLKKIHVPTKDLEIAKNGDYSSITSIVSFKQTFTTAGGVNLPKIVSCEGSDNLSYRQLVKCRDDLRQDAVMQQLFDVINKLLQDHPETRKRQLRIRGYKVIPLSPRSGVLGWVENTIPLGEYLVGTNANTIASSAHYRYRPDDYLNSDCRNMIHQASKKTYNDRINVFQDICDNFKPVFHHFFTERFPDASKWFVKRLAYTRSVAASSIVGYIIGLGDRHALNILLDLESAEVCHIDLGVAFDQGQLLPIPETIPFRLTRDIVDGFGVTGCEGVFRRCCISTMNILRQNMDLLYTILEVLLHDPLYNWSIDPGKRMRMQQEIAYASIDVKNKDAGRVLIRFKEKLQGYEDNELLGVEGHVNKLINRATSTENLSMLFHGWCAHV